MASQPLRNYLIVALATHDLFRRRSGSGREFFIGAKTHNHPLSLIAAKNGVMVRHEKTKRLIRRFDKDRMSAMELGRLIEEIAGEIQRSRERKLEVKKSVSLVQECVSC
jgi:hypothetical protein